MESHPKVEVGEFGIALHFQADGDVPLAGEKRPPDVPYQSFFPHSIAFVFVSIGQSLINHGDGVVEADFPPD
jgi:hypothetical protein